ncbi:Exopolyphosphatase [Bertholletia excelsa]
MALNLPAPTADNNHLFAAVDMGTNSFKLVIVRADPQTGRFLILDRLKEPVVLGRDTWTSSSAATAAISAASQCRAVDALRKFQKILFSHHVSAARTRHVATSAIREATNRCELLQTIHSSTGLEVDVLSGEEESRLTYLGVLQFHPVLHKTVLIIDIGGGSTEFAIGKEGRVVLGTSLKLGHVTLTEEFVKRDGIEAMRNYIRSVIGQSGLIEKVGEHGFEVVIGSSGTIRAIEKAIFHGYGRGLMNDGDLLERCRRDWRFNRAELSDLVGSLCKSSKARTEKFFKRRSEFIMAGAVLLEEIFAMIGIEEMEISGYSLSEGVIAEKLASEFEDYDLNANARWRSVVRLANRFNDKKMMKSAVLCACIAKEIFEGLRKWNELSDDQDKLEVSLNEKDLEYLEAACLLHGIGKFTGKKGYHKHSYHIIMGGNHLHGYAPEEVKIISLLAKHYRKKYPKLDHCSMEGLMEEVKQKFRILCVIIRVSVAVQQNVSINIQNVEFSHSQGCFKLILHELSVDSFLRGHTHTSAEDIEGELTEELEHFRAVIRQELEVIVAGRTS